MHLRDELKLSKSPDPGHEVALAILLTREYVARLQDKEVFGRSEISDQQYNVLRILKGGPKEGYLIKDLRCRMIFRFADVPRLVNRLVAQKLVTRTPCPHDRRGSMIRITDKGLSVEAKVREHLEVLTRKLDRSLSPAEREQLLMLMERLRDDFREQLG
ncbi:MAG TPA: MarR family transcriptional regulator [Holophagaceae bacterium]|nr:MarR family transcriptional regulator [Holophagaceae bacterium]